jgi:hypothetical protein
MRFAHTLYGFRMILRVNTDYFLEQHQPKLIFVMEMCCFL